MNRRIKIIIPFAIICSLLANTLWTRTLPVKHYSIKDGLASSFVNCIFQDSSGYLWFGTQHGVSRFDGMEFRESQTRNGQESDYVMDIFQDKNKNIWISTPRGGVCLSPAGLRTYTAGDGLPSNHLRSIIQDKKGRLWFGTYNGVSVFDGETFLAYDRENGLVSDHVRDMITDKKGRIRIGTDRGLSTVRDHGFVNHTTADGLAGNMIHVLFVDKKGNLWIGTDSGLSCLPADAGDDGPFITFTEKDGLADNVVRSITEDRDNNLWVGTDDGISLYSPTSLSPQSPGVFTNYFTKHDLPDNKISAVCEDMEGNIWFATSNGVNRIVFLDISTYFSRDGLAGNGVWAIIEDKKGQFWIGTENGLSCYSGGTFKNYTTADGLAHNMVLKLLEDRSGNIWAGTLAGLSVFSGGTFKNFPMDGLPNKVVLSLSEGKDGTIRVGTGLGLHMVVKGRMKPPGFTCKQRPVHAIMEATNGDLWFSDSTGLNRVSKGDNRLTAFSTRDGLSHNFVYSIFEDSRGRIWSGTKMGLSCFGNGTFKTFTTRDGLAHNACYFIIEETSGDLWIGTLKGINRMDGDTFKISPSAADLVTSEINQGAYLKDSRGDIWFGSVNGVTRFNPQSNRRNPIPPPVHITQFKVFDEELPIPGAARLEHNRNYIKFGFVGISFTAPADVKYKYRLKGIDPDWFETKNRSVSYAYLPPGDYTFEVTAVSSEGIESPRPAVIGFEILPPFWQTWWFRAAAAAGLALLLSLIAFRRIRRIKEKLLLRERNKQLEMAQKMELLGLLAAGAVHDLKTLLTIIVNYSGMAAKSIDNAGPDKDMQRESKSIRKIQDAASKAVRMAKQILAFTRRRHGKNRPVNLPDLLDDIIDILKITMPHGIDVRVEKPGPPIRVRIDADRFQQVVMNLCLNAVQAMPGGGRLNISLCEEEKSGRRRAMLEISDTGTGMDPGTLENIFTPFFTTKEEGKGTGLGLFVVKQIIEDYNGEITVRSRPGKGTSFVISFSLSSEDPVSPGG